MWGALVANDGWRQRLCQLRQGTPAVEASPITQIVNLGQWFQNIFAESWQALESLVNPAEVAVSLRQTTESTQTAIQRVKPIDLPEQSVLLIVALAPEEDGRVEIRTQLRPRDRGVHLPENLSLALLSTTGKMVQSVQAREQDDSIQLRRFKCAPGTQFRLQVAMNSTVVLTEDFEL
jgi:hypothetical protein